MRKMKMKDSLITLGACLILVIAFVAILAVAPVIWGAEADARQANAIKHEEAHKFTAELVSTVEQAARDSGFDPDVATGFLWQRSSADEVVNATKSRNTQELRWVFGTITAIPQENHWLDGRYEVAIKPLVNISDDQLPEEVIAHGKVKAYPGKDNINIGDTVLFVMRGEPKIDGDDVRVYSLLMTN